LEHPSSTQKHAGNLPQSPAPGLTCIDQRSLKRPEGFPNPVQVMDDVCKSVSR